MRTPIVSKKQAYRLQQLGFDDNTSHVYIGNNILNVSSGTLYNTTDLLVIKAPTIFEAAIWLFVYKNISIEYISKVGVSDEMTFIGRINSFEKINDSQLETDDWAVKTLFESINGSFKTPYDVLIWGIDNALDYLEQRETNE